jgi:hypothetical protein
MSNLEYCMGCGHEIGGSKYIPICINPACWMYGLVVGRVFTKPPKESELRRLKLSQQVAAKPLGKKKPSKDASND